MQVWCQRCLSADCSRSQIGRESRFENRVSTWEERLFLDVPRMPEHDPLYKVLSGQGFHTIDAGRVPDVRGTPNWEDPSEVTREAPARFTPSESGPAPAVQPPAPQADPTPVLGEPPTDVVTPKATTGGGAKGQINTPRQTGVMINRPLTAPAPVPAVDPWSVPATPSPAGVVVPKGARIKMGG